MMPTTTELIRRHLLETAGVSNHGRVPDLPQLRWLRWNRQFEEEMRRRLIMGAFRYECDDMNGPPSRTFDNLPSIRRRLDAYERTGDPEMLVDVANLCMIEYRYPRQPTVDRVGDDHDFHCERIS